MTLPIAPASTRLPSSPPEKGEELTPAQERAAARQAQIEWGANALTAPQTPSARLPHVDRSKINPQIVQAAEGMETMFLDYMMKVMRQSVPKNDMDLSNPATEIYQGMLDSDYAEKAAKTGGVGLADTIIAYMAPESYNLSQGPQMDPKRSKP